jgi:hypothetical protein
MYLVGQPGWENVGLHLWDEWDAYTNGATVSVDRYTRGLDRACFSDAPRDDPSIVAPAVAGSSPVGHPRFLDCSSSLA